MEIKSWDSVLLNDLNGLNRLNDLNVSYS